MAKIELKDWILDAPEYKIHRSAVPIHLHLNEVPYDIPPSLKQEIFNRLSRQSWNLYPEWRNERVHQFLSDSLRIEYEQLAIGKGLTLLLRSLFDLLVSPFSNILTLNLEYEYIDTLTKMYQVERDVVVFERNFSFPLDSFLEKLENGDYDLIYFSSPNNPTGAQATISQVEKILQKATCPVIIDECYHPFAKHNLLPLINKYSNLIIVRSMATEFGISAFRLGYVIGSEEIISGLKKVLSPFLLDIFSEAVITVVVEYKKQLLLRTERVKQIRDFVYQKLREFELLSVYPSEGNFLLIQYPLPADQIQQLYLERGILVKSLMHYPELAQMIRVTVAGEQEMKTFIKVTKELVEGKLKEMMNL